jgi:hypothetical protein
MHSLRVLDHCGCTKDRLREIFTAKKAAPAPSDCVDDALKLYKEQATKSDANAAIRERFESRIRGRIFEAVANAAQTSRPYQAVDLAWDAAPIQRETIPLMMWATGKISNMQSLYGTLCNSCGGGAEGAAAATKFFKKVPTDNEIGELDVPKICEIQIDLMRSYITRIHAGLDALWSNLWPLYRYNPRSSDAVAQLRGDALTQRIDMISESYNYRHHDSQCRRDMLLYGRSIMFPRAAWDRQTSWRFKTTNTGEETKELESYVTREGADFVNPHPSRTFFDLSAPTANINSDTGPRYGLYWDLSRYGALLDSSNTFYNVDSILTSTGYLSLLGQSLLFFGYYFDPKVLAWPQATADAPAFFNDREARVGYYSSSCRDNGVLITQYFEKITPKVEGIGDYDAEVWVRLTVAGDCTVIAAEFMPSIPACYGAINWNDNRVANQSVGMALLSYQDQASNITSHMLMQIRASLVQLWLIDKDSLEEPIRKEIEKNAANASWWVDPKVLIYSATKLRDLGIQDPRMAFSIIQTNVSNVVESGYKALTQLLNTCDRLLILSPNELGQPNPREVAAREVQEISTSVQSISSFRQQGPREQVAAKKQLLYESLVSCATDRFRVPVEGKYTKETLKAAGFSIPPDVPVELQDNQVMPVKTPIMGNLRNLIYDYYFDDRDGAERVLNTQGATVVMQLLQSLLKIPGVAQKMGMKNIYDAANLVIRMSGAPWNFQFSLADGEDGSIPSQGASPEQQGQQQQVTELLQQMAGRIQRLEGVIGKLLGAPPSSPAGAPPPGAPPPPPDGPPVGASAPVPGAALTDGPPA